MSLLTICGKVFEGILFYYMFSFFLIAQKQSRFKPDESCINQLLSITHQFLSVTHEIYKSFDDEFEIKR